MKTFLNDGIVAGLISIPIAGVGVAVIHFILGFLVMPIALLYKAVEEELEWEEEPEEEWEEEPIEEAPFTIDELKAQIAEKEAAIKKLNSTISKHRGQS